MRGASVAADFQGCRFPLYATLAGARLRPGSPEKTYPQLMPIMNKVQPATNINKPIQSKLQRISFGVFPSAACLVLNFGGSAICQARA
jgi:hypothetical protein